MKILKIRPLWVVLLFVAISLNGKSLHAAGKGLDLRGDVTKDTCYTSVLYKDITAPSVEPVRNFYPATGISVNTASGNTFTNNLNPAGRVDANAFTVANTGGPVDYNFDGVFGGLQDPDFTPNAALILIWKVRPSGICSPLPNNKTDSTIQINSRSHYKIFPNPTIDGNLTFLHHGEFSSGTILVYDVSGAMVNEIPLESKEQYFTVSTKTGFYMLVIQIDNELYYEKIVVTTH